MRKTQVTIIIERFGDEDLIENFTPPKNTTFKRKYKMFENKKYQTFYIYADSNNIYEALSKATHEALNIIIKNEPPKIGRKESTE
jgi:hypothetical protein